ncbi:ABC transporter ATP-binding protein [Streptomyces microflavus]|uniref:Multidrug ABC transporter ATP-binding protein n=1 Tax=Streptomyces microflavus TaxID=1919 RepID=A0A7J0D0W3_STRMI|nr:MULTISPECIES: ABC transporter ATP-binding protein [Streptomyces]MDX2981086.1 ABC transporter ATP-binding protein [Streptomyces sp. NRRL_B-2249]GFN07804.1 multidrug ABC transporter ATP-binding protein [Streptomyces microflavus]GGX91104.1 multidrug ABC transporter ATP-binding protein [Streptomyces microflavus]
MTQEPEHTGPSDALVRFDDVRKSFRTARGRRQQALDGFSMSIPRGSIVGLLGPNGSGKTTALKTLLGLVRPDSGSVHAFGHALPKDQRHVAGRMGALIEGPAFNASLTGEHNLRLIGELHGAGPTEVAEALELVGIAQAARRAYSGYSLGMKQRLGVAGALISGPELLVLDEPMNGLDPEAVRDMRELLKRLRDERGMTVVVSSHILAEVELVCDWVTIVRNGRVICDAGVSELISRGTEHLVVRVHDTVTEQAVAVLERHGHTLTRAAGPRGTDELRMPAPRPHPHAPEVLRLLTAQNVYPRELLVESVSLEDIYVAAVRAADAAAEDGPFDERR